MGECSVILTLDSLGLKLTGKDVQGPPFFKWNNEENEGCWLITTLQAEATCPS